MSAFVVNKSHIDAMISAGLTHTVGCGLSWWDTDPRKLPTEEYAAHHRELRLDTADATGQMLLDECIKSVSYRYPQDEITELPGRCDAEWLIPYRCNICGPGVSLVQALKLISCYEYQSCEHPEWEASEASNFCHALRHALIDKLPGYEEALWEMEDERPQQTSMIRIV